MENDKQQFDPSPVETEIFHAIKLQMADAMNRDHIPESQFYLRGNKSYSSAWLSSGMCFRLCFRGEKRLLSISTNFSDIVESVYQSVPEIKSDYYTIPYSSEMSPAEDIITCMAISKIMERVLFLLPKSFDCCHRYAECSDAKECTDPDWSHAMNCGYRRIMKTGRFFLGKNRNIDK